MKKQPNEGFTIVELLIVVVVIAILAAITIVAYNGISRNARQSIMQNDIQQIAKQLENQKTINGSYPTSLAAISKNKDLLYAYTLSGVDYFLTVGSADTTDKFRISNTSTNVTPGSWPGHDAILTGYPTRSGFANISNSYGSGDTIAVPVSSAPVGAWMIVVLTTFVGSDATPPAGWTAVVPRKTTNTMNTSIFAKIKTSGDAGTQEFEAPGATGTAYINAAFIWGENGAAISSWVIGSYGDRFNNATSSTALTPTITTATAKNLVLSIAAERTNADETNYVSLTGASPWVWIPQPTGDLNKNQTIAIGYNQQAAAGTTQAMTVTYPNAQTYNATAIQIAIPPGN